MVLPSSLSEQATYVQLLREVVECSQTFFFFFFFFFKQKTAYEINGNPDLHSAVSPGGTASLNSFGDHRIAMSMAIMGLLLKKRKIEVGGINSINTSFPGFFNTLYSALSNGAKLSIPDN